MGWRSVNKLVGGPMAPLFEELALGVGSWELGVDRAAQRRPAPDGSRPEETPLSRSYQVIRTPNRTTRGATIAWIWLAFAAFCVPRIACTVFELVRLNTSSDGTNFRVDRLIGRSTWKSTLW